MATKVESGGWLEWRQSSPCRLAIVAWARSPRTPTSKLALIGHQPDLGIWASMLVWGEAKEALILKKAGIIGLNLPTMRSPIGQSQMFLLTPPKFLIVN